MTDDRDDTAFMEELEAATRMRPSLTSNLMLLAITAFLLVALTWAALSQVEELTRGSGQVVPSSDIQFVQSLEGGILEELLISEGDIVDKGQILMRISDVAFASEERGAEARKAGLLARKARLEAEANGTAFVVPAAVTKIVPEVAGNEQALYRSRQDELRNALAILDNQVESAGAELKEAEAKTRRLEDSRASLNKELEITRKMVRQQAVPELEQIRLERDISDLAGQIRETQERRAALSAELSAAQKGRQDQLGKFRSQALGELSDVESEIAQLEEAMRAMGDRVSRTELRAPVYGVVNKVSLKTLGGVIEPAMKLVEIVPLEDALKIIARVPPHEVAFLHPGQDVNVKITAYDPQRYGALKGRLIRVGANAVNDREGNIFFEIEVHTEKNYLGDDDRKLPITPGMVAETEVVTGKRSILDYMLSPVLRARDRAFTER